MARVVYDAQDTVSVTRLLGTKRLEAWWHVLAPLYREHRKNTAIARIKAQPFFLPWPNGWPIWFGYDPGDGAGDRTAWWPNSAAHDKQYAEYQIERNRVMRKMMDALNVKINP